MCIHRVISVKETMFPKNSRLVQDSSRWTKSGGSPLSEAACRSNSALPFREHLPEPILPRPGVSLAPRARARTSPRALRTPGSSATAGLVPRRETRSTARARVPRRVRSGTRRERRHPGDWAFVTSPRIRAARGGAVRDATRVPRADSGPPPRGFIPRAPPSRRSCAARWWRTPRVAPPGDPPDAAPPAARRPEPGGTRAPRNIRIPSVRRRRVG